MGFQISDVLDAALTDIKISSEVCPAAGGVFLVRSGYYDDGQNIEDSR